MQSKIGVFLCDCGESLKNVDFSKIRGDLQSLEDIAFVDVSHNLCLEQGEKAMTSRNLAKDGINRIVIGACSPKLCEYTFTKLLERLKLNPGLLSLANIREQCSWAHEGDVTEKALELIRMAISKARLLQPVEKETVTVSKEVLVVGGGFSGMSLALELSRLGFKTTIVEGETTLGGTAEEFEGFCQTETTPQAMLDLTRSAIEKGENITVLTSSRITGIEGQAGNFTVRMEKEDEKFSRKFGAIIFTTGYMTEIRPQDFQLKPEVNIISPRKLIEMLQGQGELERKPETIGFVLDVSDENSRIPTLSALNNALAAKERLGSEVYVFCKSLKVDSEGVDELYREARKHGIIFLKFEGKLQISKEDSRVKVEARDLLLGEEVALLCDLLIAEEKALAPEGIKALSSMLNIRTDSRGFYQDENVHLYPVASERKGIFFVGGCKGNLDFTRTSTDILSATASVYELLSLGKVMVEAGRVRVEPEKCQACLTCIRVCPHSAIQLVKADTEGEVAKIHDIACDGCGICAAICPAKAIKFEGYTDEQLLAEIEAIGESV